MFDRPLASKPDLLALHQAAPRRFPCLLESSASGTQRGRYDLLLCADGSGLRLDRDGVVRRIEDGGEAATGGFLAALDREFAARQRPLESAVGGFRSGWALFLGYELAGEIEPKLRLPTAAGSMPVALALRCPGAIVVDHEQQTAAIVGEVNGIEAHALTRAAVAAASVQLVEEPAERFSAGVRRILDYIRAGDVFQVNLSRGWEGVAGELAAAELYAALRAANPAPFSGLFAWDDWAIVSSSPERLVSRRGERIETRPIAGTRPRRPGEDDAARIRELAAHPKERAEHIMLIDLERNDLGRISRTGSVKVDELMAIESYAHVHHIESTVSGLARPGLTPGELIRAVFPGGTITGCPKMRCMEIIAELEGAGRGPYTGAIGWLDDSGDLDLNILIRTLWLDQGRLRLRAGAGIVADSDPNHELDETRAKARGLLRALGCHD